MAINSDALAVMTGDAPVKLYASPPSPFARKARIVAAELGVLDQVEIVNTEGVPFDPPGIGARAANPLRKIPFLQHVDGRLVHDSLVVCLSLIEEVAAPEAAARLLPPAGAARIDVLTREALSRGIGDAAISLLYEGRYRPEDKMWPDWVEAQWGKISGGLDAMEAAVPPDGRFDLGDCAWASALSHMDMRFEDRGWRDGRPGLSAWWEAVKQRPSVQAVL